MNRITNLFNTKKNGILSVFFTAGYPNLDDTKKILKELENKGIDMVEIGIPFSDPMADGPVIQEASTAALRNGMSLHVLFEQLDPSGCAYPDYPDGLSEPDHAIWFRSVLPEMCADRSRRHDHPGSAFCRLYGGL